jgi:Asp-tRNA(Asn)/Glu-tRNA(Gln) amidotransferase C subunit
MSTTGDEGISAEAFQQIVERAGLGLSQEELERLKPLYDLYLQYVNQIHSIDLQSEEIALVFRPDAPS